MKENKKKDYYFSVLIWQTVLSAVIVLFVAFIGGTSDDFAVRFSEMIENNAQGTQIQQGILTFKEYVLADVNSSEALLSEEEESEQTVSPDIDEETAFDDETESGLTGIGGVDMTTYEAADNASFAPIYSTVEILPPVENGRYTSYFGFRTNPITNKFSFHTGLDIAAAEGTNIRAAFSGQVTKVGYDSQAGNYIYLSHSDGLVTFYCHCSEIIAQNGAYIRQGETIALVGSTGWSTGPHLHFEVRKDNIRYNPLWLLDNDC